MLGSEVPVTRGFSASVWQQGAWWVAQSLDVDLASQGESEAEDLENLQEALELHYEEPQATITPAVRRIKAEVGAV